MVTNAGQHTHGLDRCFARRYGTPVPGLAFCLWSLVSTQARCAFPMHVEQVVRRPAEKAARKAKAETKKPKPSVAKRRPGRPQGSPNNHPAEVTLPPERQHLRALLDAFLKRVAGYLAWTDVVLAGHVGNRHALPLARQRHLQLISKRRCAAALSFPDCGPYAGRGPHRKDGHTVADDKSRANTSKRRLWRGTSRPDGTRCNGSTRSVHNR